MDLIVDLELSRVVLENQYSNYPWVILIPRKNNVTELIDLTFEDQQILLKEINMVAKIIKDSFNCDKLNIATLGNVTPQLHIHIIGRFKNDPTWPNPVWGSKDDAYLEKDKKEFINLIQAKIIAAIR